MYASYWRLIPCDISVAFCSHTPHLTRVFSFTVTVFCSYLVAEEIGEREIHMPPLSYLSGLPCKTETDEAAGTCSPIHPGKTHTHTHKYTLSLYIISCGTHQGGLFVKQDERENNIFAQHIRSKKS